MRPPFPAVVARLARADGIMPSIRTRARKALRDQARWCADRVVQGLSPVPSGPDRAHVYETWKRDLFEAKRPGAMNGARDGYVLAERSVPSKSYVARLSAWKAGRAALDDVVEIGPEDSFIRRIEPQPVDRWLEESSRLETETSIRRYDEEYERLINYRDPETGFGLTPRQVARRLLDQGLAWSSLRADLMARTTSIWALNEGARQFYRDAGIRRVEWMSTEDEAICVDCASLDGRTWDASEPIFESGDTFGAFTFPFDVHHPPLHPFCRCALLPVIE